MESMACVVFQAAVIVLALSPVPFAWWMGRWMERKAEAEWDVQRRALDRMFFGTDDPVKVAAYEQQRRERFEAAGMLDEYEANHQWFVLPKGRR